MGKRNRGGRKNNVNGARSNIVGLTKKDKRIFKYRFLWKKGIAIEKYREVLIPDPQLSGQNDHKPMNFNKDMDDEDDDYTNDIDYKHVPWRSEKQLPFPNFGSAFNDRDNWHM